MFQSALGGRRVLVTGGLGFLGSNYVKHLLQMDCKVTVMDNLARGVGCEHNSSWLKIDKNAKNLTIVKDDVRDYGTVHRSIIDQDIIVHTAGQVSVPISVRDPRLDFESNVVGTFNVLEAARHSKLDPVVVCASTNKLYGAPDTPLLEGEKRFDFADFPDGVDESFPMNALEPYGVSKAAGELYARTFKLRYGLRVAAPRFSLLYGPRQWGTEEQGFVAWFCIANALGRPIRIFGNGKQVRDLLHITDAITAIDLTIREINNISDSFFNLGGGKDNSVSLLELIDYLHEFAHKRTMMTFEDWRGMDVKCFYTNCAKAKQLLNWAPRISWKEGVEDLYKWVTENLGLLSSIYNTLKHK